MTFQTILFDIWENLISIIRTMGFLDYLDIFLMSYLIYKLLKLVRETRAEQLLRGILAIVVVLLLIRQFELPALSFLSDTFFSVGLMAVIVMFQPELRRVLEKMGRTKVMQTLTFSPVDAGANISEAVEQIAGACEKLSRTATGAIIVMERMTKLGEQVDTGVVLNAMPSAELFGNIFFPNSPLHDGAVIVRDGVVLAAGCFLPKPQKEEFISKELGTRHRAAIGMSEISDAIVIVVSEETGIISTAENGALSRGYDRASLTKYLSDKILKAEESEPARAKQSRSRKIRNSNEPE
jgi:diadenylate cyclase